MHAPLLPFSLQSMPTVIALSLTDVHAAAASDTATPGQRRVKSHLMRSIDGCDSEALLAQSRQFVSPLRSPVLCVQCAAVV
jgi:hypothetical protein